MTATRPPATTPAKAAKPAKRKRGTASRLKLVLPSALLLLAFLALWQAYVSIFDVDDFILPGPIQVFDSIITQWAIYSPHVIVTTREAVLGLLLAAVVGIGLAIVIALSPPLRIALYPLLVGSQAMPVIAIAPLLIIWFGFGPTSKILVAALVAFFPIVVTAAAGLSSLDAGAVQLMRSFPASRWRIFISARFPNALPEIFSGLKVAAVLSVVGAVVGEWVGSQEGLGFLIIQSNARLATTTVFGCVVLLSLIGIALFLIVALIERIALPWRRKTVA